MLNNFNNTLNLKVAVQVTAPAEAAYNHHEATRSFRLVHI